MHSIFRIFNEYTIIDKIELGVNIEDLLKNITSVLSIDEISDIILTLHTLLLKILEDNYLSKNYLIYKNEIGIVIFKSVFRIILLKYLDRMGLLIFIEYPKMYLRIYNSKLYSKFKYIDFGGNNGFEKLYPRTADLKSTGIEYFQFDQNKMKNCYSNLLKINLCKIIEDDLTKLFVFGEQANAYTS